MKKIFTILLTLFSIVAYSQQSVIYLKSGEKIFCNKVDIRYNSVIYYKGKSEKQYIESKDNVYRVFDIKSGKCETTILDESVAKQGKIGVTLASYLVVFLRGYKIEDVLDQSILKRAGLQIDDEITHIDGIPIDYFKSSEDFIFGRTGDNIQLTVSRNGKSITGALYYYKITKIEKNADDTKTYYLDLNSVYVSSKTPKSGGSSEDYAGFHTSFNFGVGGASFKNKEPLMFAYEFELGYTGPSNFSNSFKFGIHEYRREGNEKMFAFNYRFMQHFGERRRAGFFLGMDLGILYVPNADGFFWQPGGIIGYDFHVVKHLRLGLVGNIYAIPTWNFSHVAVGGYGGVRITGLL